MHFIAMLPTILLRMLLRTLLLALGLASASALVMPATRPVATLARASSPLMQSDELHRKGSPPLTPWATQIFVPRWNRSAVFLYSPVLELT